MAKDERKDKVSPEKPAYRGLPAENMLLPELLPKVRLVYIIQVYIIQAIFIFLALAM